ncbi:dolichyl-phosphate-mannose--protein mannosyltransferase [Malassezia yamatoensis]|uniref:Dolichyl-phosphate-mannose--protein mannosyltransferase n=1 Tax=Malassezia yamatoensis TaxID=253288 RepID=A0AAJ5YT57_9BASI|nr:dolichyl-phosphate-mannose--protein mannosyltransferase [Malassezia yamatoensis]
MALGVRLYEIASPAEVVFDEVHFGKFAAYYMTRQYFFDVHPPLAKLIVALGAWIAGFDGNFEFDSIGDKYSDTSVPYREMRAFLAVIGSLQIPLVYEIMRETGARNTTAIVCASLVMLDNAQIAQARLILLDAPLVLFMLLSLYCYIKFYQQRYHEFTPRWWAWLASTGVSLALTVSCKLIGVFAFLTIGGAVAWDLWNVLDINRRIPMRKVAKHFCARVLFLLLIPLTIYVSWFWVHFAILTHSGTGDSFMSAEFQQTLEGNELLASSLELHALDSIELKHRGTNVYLHSHPEHYPHKYDDGRISSDGQQVTGYPHKDVNNFWQIFPVSPIDNDDGSFNVTRRCIYHMQHIRLLHQSTNSYLLTHDVAAPLTPTNEEVTTLPADELHANQENEQNTLWELHIEGGVEGKTTWHTHRSWIRLVHVPTRVAVWTYAKGELPSWGFRQQEVNGNKNALDKTAIWTVDSVHVDPHSPMYDLRSKPPKPRSLQSLPFLDKFAELQLTMLEQNNKLTQSHPYASRPIVWPFLLQGVSYWSSDPERRQIFFVGNPVTWWGGILGISMFCMLFAIDSLLLRRGIDQIPHEIRQRTLRTTGFFAFAWACHYMPFFLMGRQLFLHHYLPAHICAVMVLGGMLDFFTSDSIDFPLSKGGPSLKPERIRASMRRHRSSSHLALAMLLMALTIVLTLYLAPLTYGHQSLTPEQANARKLLADWQLQFLK